MKYLKPKETFLSIHQWDGYLYIFVEYNRWIHERDSLFIFFLISKDTTILNKYYFWIKVILILQQNTQSKDNLLRSSYSYFLSWNDSTRYAIFGVLD